MEGGGEGGARARGAPVRGGRVERAGFSKPAAERARRTGRPRYGAAQRSKCVEPETRGWSCSVDATRWRARQRRVLRQLGPPRASTPRSSVASRKSTGGGRSRLSGPLRASPSVPRPSRSVPRAPPPSPPTRGRALVSAAALRALRDVGGRARARAAVARDGRARDRPRRGGGGALGRLDALAPSGRWGESSRARRIVRCRAGNDPDAPRGALGAPGTSAAAGWFALARRDGTAEVIESRSAAPGSRRRARRPVGVHAYGPGARARTRASSSPPPSETSPSSPHPAKTRTATPPPPSASPASSTVGRPRSDGAPSAGRPTRNDSTTPTSIPRTRGRPVPRARRARDARRRAPGDGRPRPGLDLNVHDAESQKVAFKAKPPANWLGYRAPPPWVSALAFRGGESGDDDQSTGDGRSILVGTGEKRLRLYDTRTDKRAVMDLEAGASVITAVASCGSSARAFRGDARGGRDVRGPSRGEAVRAAQGLRRGDSGHRAPDRAARRGRRSGPVPPRKNSTARRGKFPRKIQRATEKSGRGGGRKMPGESDFLGVIDEIRPSFRM